MTDLRQAAQQALEALEQPVQEPKCGVIIEVFGKDWRLEYMSLPVGKHKLYTQQYTYIAPQPQMQPCAGRNCGSTNSNLHSAECFEDYEKATGMSSVEHAVIAGALFDFMGWLTSRKERIVLSSADNASPAVDAIKEFAEMRGLSLDDVRVQDWQNYTTPPQQQVGPVGDMLLRRAVLRSAKIVSNGRFVTKQAALEQPPLPVQEPVAWDKPSDNFNEWWDGDRRRDNANPFTTDSFAYWAFEGWQAAQRTWVGLTDEEIESAISDGFARGLDDGNVSNRAVIHYVRVIEAALREKNT